MPSATLALCYGTRPQVIKASILALALERRFRVLTVDTGQHYDYELNALLYEQLGIESPDFFLEVGSDSQAEQTARILTRSASLFERERPRAVVVIGDTNSTLGCALAAVKMRIPVVHVEAGLRASDAMMSEEVNRRVVDAVSAVLCAPSRVAADQLLEEHVTGRVVQTGDVARDVLERSRRRAPDLAADESWPFPADQPYLFVTLHRAELTDRPELLGEVLSAIGELPLPAVFAAHPRTRRVLTESDLLDYIPESIRVIPPLGYLETVAALSAATAVITDSGGLQREAYWLGTPTVTIRSETEWKETVEVGANVLVPASQAREQLRSAISERIARKRDGPPWIPDAYGTGDAAGRIADAVASLG